MKCARAGRELEAQGAPSAHEIGEPDFKTAKPICDAVHTCE